VLAVVGEFSSGKSFLLNALLGKFGLLATDINPATATITELEYGAEPEAHAYRESGRVDRIPVDRLDRFEREALGGAVAVIHRDVPGIARVAVDRQ